MNPLNDYPQARKILYLVQWVVNGVMGVLGVVYAAANSGIGSIPSWYIVLGLVFNFIWTYTGITAQTNVDTSLPPTHVAG